jgi:ADP-ribose pyrophosphatase
MLPEPDFQHAESLLVSSRFTVERQHWLLPGGETIAKDIILHPGAVVILPWLDTEEVILLRNYRLAVRETLWELPAGTREQGETAENTAFRELIEETGYQAETMTPLSNFWMSPGILREQMHAFVARGLTKTVAAPELGELLEPVVMPWSAALELLDQGQIQDAKTIACLLLWERLRQQKSP